MFSRRFWAGFAPSKLTRCYLELGLRVRMMGASVGDVISIVISLGSAARFPIKF